ncbi:MAG: flagellar hook-basal body protein [Clostridia bacterium]|nr:flagellar hook-basal body protein [Clostridia bacterium]
MIRGLYTSGWSMLANTKRMDTISNNLANVDTNAYKKDTLVMETFPNVLARRINDTRSALNPSGEVGNMQLGSDVGEIFTYYNQGKVLKTESNFDFCIQDDGSAFFTVAVPDADGNINEFYTRDGAFTLNADKQLITKEGYLVMGENGPITLDGENFTIEHDGTVIQNEQIMDKLQIRDFVDTKTLRKYGSNLVETTEETQDEEFQGKILQGSLEQSNVNIIREMVDMISVMRSYEANQKVLQAQDNTLEKAVNTLGSLR